MGSLGSGCWNLHDPSPSPLGRAWNPLTAAAGRHRDDGADGGYRLDAFDGLLMDELITEVIALAIDNQRS